RTGDDRCFCACAPPQGQAKPRFSEPASIRCLTCLLAARSTVLTIGHFLGMTVLGFLSGMTIEPKRATAALLFIIVVFVVIAPSVDLEPTVLRSGHLADLSQLLIFATCVGIGFVSLIRQLVGRAPHDSLESTPPQGDLVIFVCTLRC